MMYEKAFDKYKDAKEGKDLEIKQGLGLLNTSLMEYNQREIKDHALYKAVKIIGNRTRAYDDRSKAKLINNYEKLKKKIKKEGEKLDSLEKRLKDLDLIQG